MQQSGHEVTLVSDFLDYARRERAKAELRQESISVVVPDALADDLASRYYHPNHEYADRVYQAVRGYSSEHPLDVIEFPDYRAEGFTCIRAKRLLGEFEETTLAVQCRTPTSLLLEINNQQSLSEEDLYAVYLEDYCVLHADVVTSPSQSLARYYKTRLALDEVARIRHPLALPPILSQASPGRERSIVFAGRLEWRKGVDLLIRALAPLLRAHTDVVIDSIGGDTPTGPFETSMLEYLTQRCVPSDVAARVRFHGQLSYDDCMQRMAGASVCVFPSRWENWPNVCLEAMSLGVPVVVSRNGGMAEMVEDGISGFVVDPEDSEALRDRVHSILANKDLSNSLGQQAASRARQLCDYASFVQEIEEIYTSAKPKKTFSRLSELETVPRVSVIIPFHNQGEWLNEVVDSALDSHYENLEVIVVNDGSIDPASLAAFERLDDPRVKKISKPNGGPGSARNAGIAACSGDFILPLDADDMIQAEYVAAAVQALLNNPQLAYVTCYVKCFGDCAAHWVPVGFVRQLLLLNNAAAVSCSLFRREALEQVGGYEELSIYAEDWDLLVRLGTTSWDGDVLPRSYYHYRVHADSRTHRYRLPHLPAVVQHMVRKRSSLLREHGDELLLIAAGSHAKYQQVKPWIEELEEAIANWQRTAEEREEMIRHEEAEIAVLKALVAGYESGRVMRMLKRAAEIQGRVSRWAHRWVD
jgi:glycosyltransferase involved in cell wall biosynthesis